MHGQTAEKYAQISLGEERVPEVITFLKRKGRAVNVIVQCRYRLVAVCGPRVVNRVGYSYSRYSRKEGRKVVPSFFFSNFSKTLTNTINRDA